MDGVETHPGVLGRTAVEPRPARARAAKKVRRSHRGFVWATVALVAAALLAWAVARWRTRAATPRIQYDTATVDRGRIVARVTATGTLSALVTVQVGSQVSGRIAKLYVDYNDRVRRGEVVAEIDPQLYAAAVAIARANVDAAVGNLARARAQAADARRILRRDETLAGQHLIAQQDLDTARANAEAADAQVAAMAGTLAQARAALQQARVNLAYTRIVSPTDGVVISRNVDVGQTVAASFQAPTLFVIAEDLARMQVDTSVAEADVGKLRAGMTATFTVDAWPGVRFTGRVRQVRNAPVTVQNVVTYDAVVDVDNSDLRLKPGMTANVTFVHGEKGDVVRVPNAALRFRPPPSWLPKNGPPRRETPDVRTVWVLRDRARPPEAVTVRTGISDGTLSELVQGDVKPGDVLVTDAETGSSTNIPPAMRRGF